MALEDFLRNVSLVHKHIMRTRKMTHENLKFRKFLENSGFNADEVLQEGYEAKSDFQYENIETDEVKNPRLQKLFNALKFEQRRGRILEAELSILQEDYHKLLQRNTDLSVLGRDDIKGLDYQ